MTWKIFLGLGLGRSFDLISLKRDGMMVDTMENWSVAAECWFQMFSATYDFISKLEL